MYIKAIWFLLIIDQFAIKYNTYTTLEGYTQICSRFIIRSSSTCKFRHTLVNIYGIFINPYINNSVKKLVGPINVVLPKPPVNIVLKCPLPPKQVFVKELLFFLVDSSMPRSCLGGSGVSSEKLFMRAFNFFLRVLGLWEAGKINTRNKLMEQHTQTKQS